MERDAVELNVPINYKTYWQNEKEIFHFIPGRKFDDIHARAIQNSDFVVSAKTP